MAFFGGGCRTPAARRAFWQSQNPRSKTVEPAPQGHPFYDLHNCYLTPHIAGSSGDELHRMAEYMLSEYRHWRAGERCEYEVVESMLAIMA